jgi:tetrapyrrole methylase family protein/MazG family protein
MGRDLRSLVELVGRLRSPKGCPWDREQTHKTLTSLLIEEAYEVVGAIEAEDHQSLKEELGDLLLHVAFHVQIAKELGEFDLEDVLNSVHEKVIRRHPHVFGGRSLKGMAEIKANWEALKHGEGTGTERLSALPALVEARKALDRLANLGLTPKIAFEEFERGLSDVRAWLAGELDAEELGLKLLQLVALARQAGLDAEWCLKKANARLSQKLAEYLDHQRGANSDESP